MKDPNYQQICKTLLDASEGTPLTKLEKLGEGKPLKKDPHNLKSKAAAKFLNKHGLDIAQKAKAQAAKRS